MVHWLEVWLISFQGMGFLGWLLFVVAAAVLMAAGLPVTPFALASGLLFGVWGGIAGVACGSTLGAAGGFLLSRYLARDWVARVLLKRPRFAQIDRAIRREGWKIITLLRLCPIPFGLGNFAYGLTSVPLWHYLAATAVGVLPDEAVFAYLGSAGRTWLNDPDALNRTWEAQALFYTGLVAAVLALVLIHKLVRRHLEEE